ncbi:AAA family ATPase [Halobacteriales archaeon QS_8_69_26]|nr:MAG: AAA family ATPase [Halobacteriales archaeon QS_8_69_26]
MSRDLAARDGDAVDLEPGTARLDAGSMADLSVEEGGFLSVRGSDATAVRVGPPVDGDPGIYLDAETRSNAGVDVEGSATVAAAAPVPAESLVVAPTRRIRFEGDALPVASDLRGRPVTEGDAVRLSLFGDTVTVTFVVADVEPSGPAVVAEGTSVTARTEPVEDPGFADAAGVTFDDVGGLDEERRRLRQLVELPLERPDLFDRLGDTPASGVLLHGPTGTGKTLLAHALGNESDAHFVPVAPGSDGYEEGLDAVLEEARSNAPAIVFLDDLDAVAPSREEAGGTDRRTVGELFSFLDAAGREDDVAVVGATSRVDAIDEGLRRGGRFDHEIAVEVPDRDDRAEILAVLTRDLRLDAGVDLGTVADRTHGYVGADLATLVGEALRRAVDRLPEGVQFGDEPLPDDARVAVTAEDIDGAMEAVTPTGVRTAAIERPDVTYRDVGGLDVAKREVIRAVEWPLRFPDLFERLSTDPPTGVLLYGPPGTGKTMLARAVANSTDANFLSVDGPELLNKYVGESERGVRDVFERARRSAPAVVFFDEVDALAPQRGGESDTGAVDRVVSQLLTELDGVEPGGEVVVVAATNRPDMVDRALLRPGRLERVVEVPMPDREARREIFRTHLRGVPAESLDVDALAAQTDGYTGSDIEAVVREAKLLAMEDHVRERTTDRADPDPSTLRVARSHFGRALKRVDPSVTEEMHRRYARVAEEFDR